MKPDQFRPGASLHPLVRARTRITTGAAVRLDGSTFPPHPAGHVFGDRYCFLVGPVRVHAPSGLVFTEDRRFLRPSGPPLRDPAQTSRAMGAAEEVALFTLQGRIRRIDRRVFPIGVGPIRNYFHWNVDVLPRILHAHRTYPDVVIVLADSPRHATESLEAANIEFIVSSEVLLPAEVVLVDFSDPGWMHPSDAELLREFAGERVGSVGNKRVFLSRADTRMGPIGTRNRRIENEEELEEAMSEAGFDIVVPGTMPFREQVASVAYAEIVAGIHGAGMSNLLWCQKRAHVIEIVSQALFDAGPRRLAAAAGHRYSQIILPPSPGSRYGSADAAIPKALSLVT